MKTPSIDITENVSDDEFGSRFLAYVDDKIAYHTGELASLNDLRQLWIDRQTAQEVANADAQ